MGDHHVGLQARLMSQALRKLTGNIKTFNCLVIFINQIRMKIGVMFGNPETTTGGNALKFYASVRLDIRRIGAVKEGEEVVGGRTPVKVVMQASLRTWMMAAASGGLSSHLGVRMKGLLVVIMPLSIALATVWVRPSAATPAPRLSMKLQSLMRTA